MKSTIANRKLIRFVVKYEKKVDDKCVNQTSHNSSGSATEHWQILLSNNVSSVVNVMGNLSNLISSHLSGSNAERNEVRAVCTLQPSPTAATSHQTNAGVSADDLSVIWLKLILGFIFMLYSLAFLCLFSPTEVKENGVRHIILEGASPVSFRGLMGNYFFSGDDGTIWHKARTFTLFVVILPALFLPPAIAHDKNYLWGEVNMLPDLGLGKLHLFHPFYLACYACYVFQAILLFFLSFQRRTCLVCDCVQPDIYICRDQELPGQIIHYLRQQPLILLKCWRLFLRYLVNYFRVCIFVALVPCKVSVSSFLAICLFPILLLSMPLVALMLLTIMSLVAVIGLVFTSPFCPVTEVTQIVWLYADIDSRSTISTVAFTIVFGCCFCCCSFLTRSGEIVVLYFVAYAIMNMKSLIWAITKLLLEDSLPYLACLILFFYYVCSSYSSFTSKYQVLALTLYKHHKKSPVVADQETERNTPIPGTLMRIPKELFDEACEQLMPIRVSVCILVLRVALILTFVFVVFFFTILFNVSVTPVTKALVTFLSGSLPKIIDIFISDGGQKNIETIAIDEKVPYIIEHYKKSRVKRTQKTE